MKKVIAIGLLLWFCVPAEAQDMLKAVVSGDNVNIRTAPSRKGKVAERAQPGDIFLVDPVSVDDPGDNLSWYKILYTTEKINMEYFSTLKDPAFANVPPYISTAFVSTEPLSENDLKQLEWLRAGKPVIVEIGDDMKDYVEEGYVDRLEAALEVRRNPSQSASIAPLLPVGQKVVTAESLLHRDTDGIYWTAVIDAETYRLLGWVELARWKDFPREDMDPVSGDAVPVVAAESPESGDRRGPDSEDLPVPPAREEAPQQTEEAPAEEAPASGDRVSVIVIPSSADRTP